jgi:hypothetical protein
MQPPFQAHKDYKDSINDDFQNELKKIKQWTLKEKRSIYEMARSLE